MNDFNQPPIPSPFEPLRPTTAFVLQAPRVWKDAPKIVKGWASPLMWLAIIVLPIVILAILFGGISNIRQPGERIGMAFFYLAFWAVAIWHNRSLKKGAPHAWVTRIVLSILGLCGFPLGTFINIYILSQ